MSYITRSASFVSIAALAIYSLLAAPPLPAQPTGTASGRGVIERQVPSKTPDGWPEVEKVAFSPRYAFAYREKGAEGLETWLVLAELEPPMKSWLAAPLGNRAELRRLWCEKEKASFVAAEINRNGGVELFFLCPGNGFVNTEMVSTTNGLASVEVRFDEIDGRLRGTLRGGDGWCNDTYCEQTEDYTFDAPLTP